MRFPSWPVNIERCTWGKHAAWSCDVLLESSSTTKQIVVAGLDSWGRDFTDYDHFPSAVIWNQPCVRLHDLRGAALHQTKSPFLCLFFGSNALAEGWICFLLPRNPTPLGTLPVTDESFTLIRQSDPSLLWELCHVSAPAQLPWFFPITDHAAGLKSMFSWTQSWPDGWRCWHKNWRIIIPFWRSGG